jgi:DNA polymerase III sliding clamp (beta) subunit (PCNA family)
MKLEVAAKGLKAIISVQQTLSEEALLEIEQEGLIFKTMDASHFSAVYFMWPKEKLGKIEDFEQKKIAYRVNDLYQILKRFSNTSQIELIFDKSLILKSENKEFSLRLLEQDLEYKVPSKLHTELPVRFEISPAELKEIIEDARAVEGDYINFIVKDNHVIFECAGDYHQVKISWKDISATNVTVGYRIEFIASVLNAVYSYCENIKIAFGEKKPLSMEFVISDIGNITFLLAPLTHE